ncbi:unnamed protein product [Heterobilharzia americana]|nr:unnamed protein product [Heterobilharzia americana]
MHSTCGCTYTHVNDIAPIETCTLFHPPLRLPMSYKLLTIDSSMKMTSSMNVMMELKSSRQTLQEIDKYTKRVIVFLFVETSITSFVTFSLHFLHEDKNGWKTILLTVILAFSIVLEIVTISLLTILKLTRRFPTNLLLTMLHSLCISALFGIPFADIGILWHLAVWGVALVLYIATTAVGAVIRNDIFHYWVLWLIYYIVTIAVTITIALLVYFEKIAIALEFGQITLGEPQFRLFDADYCLASIFSHSMLILFLVTCNIAFTVTKSQQNQTHHVYDIF